MHSKAVSQSFEPYVLSAAHHWQKWNASSFSPWHFEHRALPRVSDTHIISFLSSMLATSIPQIRRDSTAPRTGRMERISRSRFRRAYRTWHVGARRKIGAVPPNERKCCYCVLVERGNRSRCALRVLITLCVSAFVYQCVGVAYPCDVLVALILLSVLPKVYLYRLHTSSAERVRIYSVLVVCPKELAVLALGRYLY